MFYTFSRPDFQAEPQRLSLDEYRQGRLEDLTSVTLPSRGSVTESHCRIFLHIKGMPCILKDFQVYSIISWRTWRPGGGRSRSSTRAPATGCGCAAASCGGCAR